jgi:hypothetical protein
VAINFGTTIVSTRPALSETQSGFDLGAGNASTGLMGGAGELRIGTPVADALETNQRIEQDVASYISQTTSADSVTIQGRSRSSLDSSGLSIQRPEIIGMFDFPPCFDSAGNPSPAAQLLDVQYQFKQSGYTTATSMLLPLTGSLPDRKSLFSRLSSDTLEVLEGYKDVLNDLNKILPLYRIREAFIRTDLLASDIIPDYEKFEDVYAASQKNLVSILRDERGIDRDILTSMSNSAIYLQALKEAGLIMRYGSFGTTGREYTRSVDGYSSFPITTDKTTEYREIVDALNSVTNTSSTRDFSVVTSARISDLCSIVSRNLIADTYDLDTETNELQGGPESAISAILSENLNAVEFATSQQSARVASVAISTTYTGDYFLPFETAAVKKQNLSFRSGRDVFTSAILSISSLSNLSSDEIGRYYGKLQDAFSSTRTSESGATQSNLRGPRLPAGILGYTIRKSGSSRAGGTTSNDPFEICLLSLCIKKYAETLSYLSSSDTSFEDMFIVNLIALSKQNPGLFRVLSNYVYSRERDSNFEVAATDLSNYIKNTLQQQNSTSVTSRSLPEIGRQIDLAYSGSSLTSLLESTIMSRSSESIFEKIFGGITETLLDILESVDSTLNLRLVVLRASSDSPLGVAGVTRYLDSIKIEAIYGISLAIFADLISNSLTIGAKPLSASGNAKVSSIFNKPARLNRITYYPTQIRVAALCAEALQNYTTDVGLTESLGIIQIDSTSSSQQDLDVTSDARTFCAIYQDEYKRILRESLALISLLSVPETLINTLVFSSGASSSSSSEASSEAAAGPPTGTPTGTSAGSRSIMESTTALMENVFSNVTSQGPVVATSRVTAAVPSVDRDFFVQNFTIDQLHTGVASLRNLTNASKDHPFFPLAKVINSYDLINLKSFIRLVGPSGNDSKNRILTIGLPAGMIDYLRNKARLTDYSRDSSYQIYLRVYGRNQRQDSDPVYIADYQFDSRIFVLPGQEESEYLDHDTSSIDELFRSTPFKKISGTGVSSVDINEYLDKSLLINHFNDYYCKTFLRASIGVDLNEHSFCFAGDNSRRAPDISREQSYASAIASIATKYPNNSSEISLYAEILKQSIFFNYDGFKNRSIYTKKFDRIFCIPISLNQFAQESEDQISMQDFFCSVIVGSPPEQNPSGAIITTRTIEDIASSASTANRALSAGMSLQDSARSQVEQNVFDSIVGRGVSGAITQPPASVITDLQSLRVQEQTKIADRVFKSSVLSETRSAIENALSGFPFASSVDAASLSVANQGANSTVLVAEAIQLSKSVVSTSAVSSPAILSTASQRAVPAAVAVSAASVTTNAQQNVSSKITASAAASAATVSASAVTGIAAAQAAVTTAVKSVATRSAATSRYKITSKVRS